jgi:hypothetical protein
MANGNGNGAAPAPPGGGTSLRLPTPQGVLLLDALATDAGGLLPTSENFLTRYGAFVARPGLDPLGQDLLANEPILGHFWTRDQQEKIQLVVATTKRWYWYGNASGIWSDLSGAGPALTGRSTQPVIFTYWEEGNFQYVIGVNDQDLAVQWQVGTANYTSLSSYIAKSVCTVANRLLYGNVTIGGVRFPTMVAWSSVGQRAVNLATSRAKLLDTGDPVISVRRMGRLSAVIYREQSQWVATAQAGSDAQAFQFTVQDVQPGPVGPAAITTGPGLRHTYLGNDMNLYTFDGVQATMLAPTAGLLQGRLNAATARQLTSVQYSPADQETWCAMALDGDQVPTHVLVYSYQTGGVFLHRLRESQAAYTLGTWYVELGTPTNLLPNIPTDTLPDVPTNQLGFNQGQSILIAGGAHRVYMLSGVTDEEQPIACTASYLLPLIPGGEHEFNGIEVLTRAPGVPITVSARVGSTMDTLTKIPLGTLDPAIIPPPHPNPLDDVMAGPNLTTLMAQTADVVRGRIVILDFQASSLVGLKIQRLELMSYPRQSENG